MKPSLMSTISKQLYITFFNTELVIDENWQSPYPDDPFEYPEGRDEIIVTKDVTEPMGPYKNVVVNRIAVLADGHAIANTFGDDSWQLNPVLKDALHLEKPSLGRDANRSKHSHFRCSYNQY